MAGFLTCHSISIPTEYHLEIKIMMRNKANDVDGISYHNIIVGSHLGVVFLGVHVATVI